MLRKKFVKLVFDYGLHSRAPVRINSIDLKDLHKKS